MDQMTNISLWVGLRFYGRSNIFFIKLIYLTRDPFSLNRMKL